MPWLDYQKPEIPRNPDWVNAIIFFGVCFLYLLLLFALFGLLSGLLRLVIPR